MSFQTEYNQMFSRLSPDTQAVLEGRATTQSLFDRDLALVQARNDQADLRSNEENKQCLVIFLAFVAGCCVATCAYHFISLL